MFLVRLILNIHCLDKYCANHKLELGALGRTASPFFISSTPVRKNDCRLCKSASGLRKRTDHILRSYDFSKGTSNLNTSKLKDFNNSAPNLMEPIRVRNESLMAWDEGNSEPQVRH